MVNRGELVSVFDVPGVGMLSAYVVPVSESVGGDAVKQWDGPKYAGFGLSVETAFVLSPLQIRKPLTTLKGP